MQWRIRYAWPLIASLLLLTAGGLAQTGDINGIGGFEQTLPSYWTKGNEPGGATLAWATDQSRSLGHSLKITKSATADSAAWISENMCDIWSPTNSKNVDMLIGAYVMTSGVNTAPSTDDQKWYIAYTFYDSAMTKIGTVKLPINQTTATSSGWVADTNGIGTAILPRDSWKTIISFVGGKNATGTVWADDFMLYGRGGAWAGQDWNTSVGVPAGWYYWLPPNGGNDALLNSGFENTVVTSEAAHSGTSSLKFVLPADRLQHDGFVGTRRYMLNDISSDIKPGDMLRLSVWIKASNLVPDSAALYPDTWSVGFTPGFFAGNDNNLGYSPVGSQNDYHFVFPHVTAFNWTQYYLDVPVPNDTSAKAIEVRLHVYARFTGTIYFDDLSVRRLDVPDMNAIGGFEQTLPSYWTKGNEPGGATLAWATDQSRSLGHSLKITKSATADSAAWISENMCDIWSPTNSKNVDMLIGAYVMTSGVNTAPSTDDQKWYIAYTFYDSAMTKIGTVKLPINQTTATSSGWVADTNGIGTAILPRDSWKTIISFVGGKNATGTVWADDFMLYGRGGAWAGQDWNTSVGVPAGWYYWLPPNGGNDALLNSGFENTVVTSEAAHSGTSSLKFVLPADRLQHDGFVGTRRFLINGTGILASSAPAGDPIAAAALDAKPGDFLRISVWIKASNLVPDSAALYPDTWSVGFTPGFFAGNDNNLGYSPVGSQNDYHFVFPHVTSFDWTRYYLDVQIPNDISAKALEVRLHIYARFTGTIYFDDLTVEKLDVPDMNAIGGFEQTLPSYWTKGNEPGGATLAWATDQSRSLGHSLKITKSATADSAAWISENMCDIWSPTNSKNVDMLIGAYVMTSGVNTAPSTDDQKWYIAYTFYDSAMTKIGTVKLPINQTTATSSGWVADTNGIGTAILPRDSWKTIISFVGGKNATGTVWADDFMLYGRGGAWAGQDWNTSVGVPAGWYYWLPPNGGNDALLNSGFENTVVTSEAAHSGTSSLKFVLPADRLQHDGFVGTRRYLLAGTGIGVAAQNGVTAPSSNNPGDITVLSAKPGDILHLSVWIKASNLVPDSAALYPDTWSVGFTPGFFAGNDNNLGYSPVGSQNDYHFVFPHVTAFNWTQYSLDVQVPNDTSAKALEVRLHIYARFTGTIYFDDLTINDYNDVGTAVQPLAGSNVPKTFELLNNYPNPFNPSTTIQYGVPRAGMVSLVVYNILGQRVRTLVDGYRSAARYTAVWDGRSDDGQVVNSGVYFFRLESGSIALVRKMLLLK